MSKPIAKLYPDVPPPLTHADILRYAEEQRFRRNGGLVVRLPDQPTPRRLGIPEHHGVVEFASVSDAALIYSPEPVMTDFTSDTTRRFSEQACREMREGAAAFDVAVALLAARLVMDKPEWPPTDDDGYALAMAHAGA